MGLVYIKTKIRFASHTVVPRCSSGLTQHSPTKSESLLSPRSAGICHLFLLRHHVTYETYLGIVNSGNSLRVSVGLHMPNPTGVKYRLGLSKQSKAMSAISCLVYQIFLSIALARRPASARSNRTPARGGPLRGRKVPTRVT
jgi:hypothetical protein